MRANLPKALKTLTVCRDSEPPAPVYVESFGLWPLSAFLPLLKPLEIERGPHPVLRVGQDADTKRKVDHL